MIFLRSLIFITLGLTSVFSAAGQSDSHQYSFFDSIYLHYRDRLRQKFIAVDSCVEYPGTNIPAVEIDRKRNLIDWGDANSNMSHYLGILATEFALNKRNHKSLETTTKELFYALLALERLDLYSEAYYRNKVRGINSDTLLIVDTRTDINGFHLRDDVSSDFWKKYKGKFDADTVQSVFLTNRQALSQDNIIHNLEGLALVAKLTERTNVKNIPVFFYTPLIPTYLQKHRIWEGDTVDFPRWAQNLSHRYLSILYHANAKRLPQKYLGLKTHWYLSDPIQSTLVPEGSGKDLDLALFYNYGIRKAVDNITYNPTTSHPGFLKKDGFIFKILFCYRITMISNKTILFQLPFDDYKLRSLATLGNVMGVETYRRLILYRNVSPVYSYEHFPLIWLILHADKTGFQLSEPEIETERCYYLNLFCDIPTEGPTSNNSTQWRITSRLVWPENQNRHLASVSEFSGMDFMLLYNLFRLTLTEKPF
ncbi:MAG TPA: hypothetical protein PK990_00310 [Salinivirgaceae bacterium]|nr:hypothetical protein [Salinivirgaceae bacterium]